MRRFNFGNGVDWNTELPRVTHVLAALQLGDNDACGWRRYGIVYFIEVAKSRRKFNMALTTILSLPIDIVITG